MDLSTLAARLERLERQNRRLRISSVVVFIGIMAIGMAGYVTAFPQDIAVKSVLAEEFVLVDQQGDTLARWRVQPGKGNQRFPQIEMTYGDYRTVLSPHSLLFYADQSQTASLFVNESSLGYRDEQGRTRTLLDSHGLSLHAADGAVRALFGSIGSDYLRTDGTPIRSDSQLVLFDRGGKVTFKAPSR